MFARTGIRTLLSWGFGVIIVLIAVMALVTYLRAGKVTSHITEVSTATYPKVAAATEIKQNVLRNWANTLMLLVANDANESKRITTEMAANSKSITDKFNFLEQAVVTEDGKRQLVAMQKVRTDYTEHRKQYLELVKSASKEEANRFLSSTLQAKLDAYTHEVEGMIQLQSSRLEDSNAEAVSLAANLKVVNLSLSLLVVLVAIATALVVVRVVGQALGGEVFYANDIARQIAAGNLGVDVRTLPGDKDSLLASMKAMREQLREMVASIGKSSALVSQAAHELAEASQSVADASGKQSEATSAAAASIEQMTVSISHIADNTNEAYSISVNSEELSHKGSEIIRGAAAEMGKIGASVTASSQIIATLEQQSREISEVVNVIKEIADQTNLLALNAAIEAARAGEQGRGFAVVADEVRKLAERTTQSTSEVAVTIQKIQADTQNAVKSMDASVDQVQSGTALTQQAGSSIVVIESAAKRVAAVVNDITHSLKEQTSASNEVARNIENIASMVEANNIAASKAASSAQQLEQLAEELARTVGTFRL
jgi:methyl-accepting chemotaxis protein